MRSFLFTISVLFIYSHCSAQLFNSIQNPGLNPQFINPAFAGINLENEPLNYSYLNGITPSYKHFVRFKSFGNNASNNNYDINISIDGRIRSSSAGFGLTYRREISNAINYQFTDWQHSYKILFSNKFYMTAGVQVGILNINIDPQKFFRNVNINTQGLNSSYYGIQGGIGLALYSKNQVLGLSLQNLSREITTNTLYTRVFNRTSIRYNLYYQRKLNLNNYFTLEPNVNISYSGNRLTPITDFGSIISYKKLGIFTGINTSFRHIDYSTFGVGYNGPKFRLFYNYVNEGKLRINSNRHQVNLRFNVFGKAL